MTDAVAVLVVAAPLAPALVAVAVLLCRSARAADRVGHWGGLAAALPAAALGALALARAGEDPATGGWWRIDAPGGVFLATIAAVGAVAAATSPGWLRGARSSRGGALRVRRLYWGALHLFWAALVAVPIVDDLAVAWVLIEATTAASALLVAVSGTRRAIEAGWKYLVLTTLGLAVALFGIVVLSAAAGEGAALSSLGWAELEGAAPRLDGDAALAAFVLIVAGLAAKAGWAPVHNWLPDAHGEAPPPVSALLSAALLPTVALVAWRLSIALEPALGPRPAQALFVGLGLVSLAVAVPFLWRPLPWKRLLAYSSLEHMGVIALAIGIGHPLATAGALLHVAGHGVAKSLGFAVAVPLLRYQPAAGRRPARGLAELDGRVAGAAGVSLAALAGMPPSPLFVSEVLVLAGGFAAGLAWASAVAAVLLALGFLGMAHALLEGLGGRPTGRRPSGPRATRAIAGLTALAVAALLALAAVAHTLPGSALAEAMGGGA
ncbi:proton-conducting transporter membrane subunit [Miltoncostaea marina]|uniref:proton-conducting transporter transmembrane domain-containing protein n=1 Tax=Miltoncostaea marina TaxID=2843215 RepID=UPI001C3C4615|nr:proton-conducting transporter membrane subunit [Miltoncostaea marina]